MDSLSNTESKQYEGVFPGFDQDIAVIRQADHLSRTFRHDGLFDLLYIRDGHSIVSFGDYTIALEAGDVCVISPGTEHRLQPGYAATDIVSILIQACTFSEVFGSLLRGRDVLAVFFSHALLSGSRSSFLIFRTSNDAHLRQFFDFILQEEENSERYKSRMLNVLLNTVLIVLLRYHDDHVIFPPSNDHTSGNEVIEMIHYIQTHFADLSLPVLADHFGYSKRHTSRLIRSYTGMSYTEFVRTLKLKRAADILTSTSLPLSSISEVTGYSDLSSFYRAFRKEYGMTPAEYREKNHL